MPPLRPCQLGSVTLKALEEITDGFREENYIGSFQFGKLYRGCGDGTDSKVVVKVYENVEHYEVRPGDNDFRALDEEYIAHEDYVLSHPNMIKFYAVCLPEERSALIYEIDALDTVHNLIDKDSFSWLQRVKVAHGFASMVAHMHDYRPVPYLIRNISASHILLDQEYNAKLYDFSMISGGNLADKRDLLNQYLHGCHGYADPDYIHNGKWSEKCDVFAYGVVLLSLLSKKFAVDKPKKINPEPLLYEWAHEKYQQKSTEQKFEGCNFSLVHKSLEAEKLFYMTDGVAVTKLAMQCVDPNPLKRPTMKQVVRKLGKLSIIRNHADLVGFENAPTASNFSMSGIGKLVTNKLKFYSKIERRVQQAMVKKLVGKDDIQLTKKDFHIRPPMILSYEDLERLTDGFSEKNYIDMHMFGKLYHGELGSRAVTVKTWEDVNTCTLWDGDNESRLKDELVLLQHPKFVSHPHIAKLIGYSYEVGRLGVVYDLDSLQSLMNLIEKDSFTWHCRINFAVKLAGVLKSLQNSNPPYVLRNLFPNNILVDKDYNPKLFNFGMIEGGIMNARDHCPGRHLRGWMYYTDPYMNCYEYYTIASDIYSFGMVLLNLIVKKIEIEDEGYYDHQWAYDEYERAASKGYWGLKRFSLVEKSFTDETGFDFIQGQRISKLIMQCIARDFTKRPTINQIVNCLEKLVRH